MASSTLEKSPMLKDDSQEDVLVRIQEEQKLKEEPPLAIPLQAEEIAVTEKSLTFNPPKNFPVHRQSMVYSTLLLYLQIELTGCKFRNRRLAELPF
jgi:hypothetical protein